jgi:hypothetical protein
LLRRCAALDAAGLAPAQPEGEPGLFPTAEREPLLLAEIRGITLKEKDGGWQVTGGEVHMETRPSHVATRTIQELLAAVLETRAGGGDAGGPRADPESVSFAGAAVSFAVNRDLHAKSVAPGAFAVGAFDEAAGWQAVAVNTAVYSAATGLVTLGLASAPTGKALRLIARGTGEAPLLGTDFVPLAGALGDPPASPHQGRDFIYMKTGD